MGENSAVGLAENSVVGKAANLDQNSAVWMVENSVVGKAENLDNLRRKSNGYKIPTPVTNLKNKR